MPASRAAVARGVRMRPPAHSGAFLEPALLRDARAIAALRTAAGRRLAERFGAGPWGSGGSERGVRFEMRRGVVYVRRERAGVVATMTLSPRKPWAIDPAFFTPARRPLHLTGMVVAPDQQGSGLGRNCLAELDVLALDWGADAVRLAAWDAPAGAGGFYAACGWSPRGGRTYRGAPLLYFERRF